MKRSVHLLQLTPLACAAVLLASHALAEDAQSGAELPPPSAELDRAAAARVERVAEAERLAEAAFAAYQQQQYRQAIELYEQAWAAAPSADIAFNIARIYDRALHDPRSALGYYQRCVAAPKASPERRLSAEQRISELQAELAGSEPAQPVSTAAPDPARAVPAARAPAPVVPTSPWTPRKVTALIVGGAGVSALGVGLGFALSASGERSEWERGCDGNACTSQSAVNAARSAGRKADIATVTLASGAALLGIGGALWLLGSPTSESAPRAELRLGPSGHATDLTCTLSGRF